MSSFRITLNDLTVALQKNNERIDILEARPDSLETKYCSKNRSNYVDLET